MKNRLKIIKNAANFTEKASKITKNLEKKFDEKLHNHNN